MTFKVENGSVRPVLYSELIRFFTHSGRSTTCSACGQSTLGWTVHIDGNHREQSETTDPYLVEMIMPVRFPSSPDIAAQEAKVFCIECPRCSHMEFINSSRVLQFLSQEAQNG